MVHFEHVNNDLEISG